MTRVRAFAWSALFGLAVMAAAMLSVVPAARAQLGGDVVEGIAVQGNQRIEGTTIRTYMTLREGDAFDPARMDRSIKNLFATGLFADVNISRQGNILLVRVVENPIINRISLEGNNRIDDDDLNAELQLRPRVVYTRTKVQQDVEKILDLYRRRGRFGARVEPKVIELPENRVDLVFEITEGDPTYVRTINFVGNIEFDDDDLRDVVLTREERWWRFLTSNDTYDPERMNYDRELLRRFYLENGYADFEVISAVAELAPNRESFYLTFTINEGPRYRVGTVDTKVGIKDFPADGLDDVVIPREGEWYNAREIDDTITAVTDAVGSAGYAFVEVQPRMQRDQPGRKINMLFEVQEGPRVFVERIDVKGNVRTLDKVVRREVLLVEGDAFNTARVRRSKERLENLGFFKEVAIDNAESEVYPDRTIVTATVEEQATGELSFGIGYSSASGALFDIGIRERNLLGKGQDLRANLSLSKRVNQIDLSFREPYFMDRRLLAGGSLFATETDYEREIGYISRTVGGTAIVGFSYNEYFYQRLIYNLSWTTLRGISAFSSQYVQEQAGTSVQSSVNQTITYDRRDNVIKPTDGYYVSLSTDLSGLGGTERFVRAGLAAGWFTPVFSDWVLGVTTTSGYIVGLGKDVKIFQRYQLGGSNLRGFDDYGASARDARTLDALGGDWIAVASAELKIPLGLSGESGITPKLFTDWGIIGSPKDLKDRGDLTIADARVLRGSAGIGVEWESPVGPILLDWAPFIFNQQPFDDVSRFRVNFGQRF